ncbi:hypothetical protein MTO96_001587 [Rhipicephalus appendiculatus]
MFDAGMYRDAAIARSFRVRQEDDGRGKNLTVGPGTRLSDCGSRKRVQCSDYPAAAIRPLPSMVVMSVSVGGGGSVRGRGGRTTPAGWRGDPALHASRRAPRRHRESPRAINIKHQLQT